MTITSLKQTVDRYHHAVEMNVFDDVPVELLNEELIEMSPEGVLHAGLSKHVPCAKGIAHLG